MNRVYYTLILFLVIRGLIPISGEFSLVLVAQGNAGEFANGMYQVINEDRILTETNHERELANGDHAPGELIIKFKEDTPIAVTASVLFANNQPFSQITNDGYLDELNKTYKCKKITPLLARLSTPPMRGKITKAEAQHLHNDVVKNFEKKIQNSRNGSKRRLSSRRLPNLETVYTLELDTKEDIIKICELYEKDPHIAYAQPNYIVETNAIPDDPFYHASASWEQPYDDLWGLKHINAEPAWDISEGDNVIVAVLDTGVDYTHKDIAENMWTNSLEIPGNGVDDDENGYIDDHRGWDFNKDKNSPMDDHGHGTHVAGTLAAIGNNGLGIIGVAPKAKIMPLKGLSSDGRGFSADLAKGIIYAADNGASVINNSWGCGFCPSNPVVEDAVRYAYGLEVVVVFAAGNSRRDTMSISPQNMNEPVTVSAITHEGDPASFTNFGHTVDVAAPGAGTNSGPPEFEAQRNILSLKSTVTSRALDGDRKLIVENDYVRQAGTSMAAPHVAGLAALVISKHPEYSVEQIRQVIRKGSDDIGVHGFDVHTGHGRINALKTLNEPDPLKVHFSQSRKDAFISGVDEVAITGLVDGPGLNQWILEYTAKDRMAWTTIQSSMNSIDGTLAVWDIRGLADGPYILRLQGENLSGEIYEDYMEFMVDQVVLSSPTSNPIQFFRPGDLVEIKGTVFPSNLSNFHIRIRRGSGSLLSEPLVTLQGGGTTRIRDDVLAIWDTTNVKKSDYYVIDLIVTTDHGVAVESSNIVVDPTLHPGWPIKIRTPTSGITLSILDHLDAVDLNDDGASELIIGDGKEVDILTHTGESLVGWPQPINTLAEKAIIQQSPVLGDLTGDDLFEIIAMNNRGHLYIWQIDGTLLPGWPRKAGSAWDKVVINDIDEDGNNDIIVASRDGRIRVYDVQGRFLPGWPKRLSTNRFPSFKTPSVGDVNRDGHKEIVVVEATGKSRLTILDYKGNILPGWPVEINPNNPENISHSSMPVLGDLDGDGDLEIVIGTLDGFVHAFHHDGHMVSGWPQFLQPVRVNNPVIGDLDQDGTLEIVVGVDTLLNLDTFSKKNYLFAWHADGSLLPGWPVIISTSSSFFGFGTPNLTDIDNNGTIDILVSSDESSQVSPAGRSVNAFAFHAFDLNGNELSGFPKPTASLGSGNSHTPATADLDGDGLLEIAWMESPFSGNLFVWDTDTPSSVKQPWPMFRRDPQNTGNAGFANIRPKIKLDRESYTWTNKVIITIIAPAWNVSSHIVDSIGRTAANPISITTGRFKLDRYKLVETGTDTGIFVGEVTLTGFLHDADGDATTGDINGFDTKAETSRPINGGPTNGNIPSSHDDEMIVTFQLSPDEAVISSALIHWNTGDIQWIGGPYLPGEEGVLQVIDPDMNLNPNMKDQFKVKVWSDTNGSGIDLQVVETGLATAIFTGSVVFSDSQESAGKTLKVAPGASVTAKYEDNTLPDPFSPDDKLDILAVTQIAVPISPIKRVPASNLRVSGGGLGDTIPIGQQVQITADLKNEQAQEQAFTYIIQIKNEKDIVILLTWITGALAPKQSFSPAIGWIPDTSGVFEVTLFIWESIDNALPLSETQTTKVFVAANNANLDVANAFGQTLGEAESIDKRAFQFETTGEPNLVLSTDKPSYCLDETMLMTGEVTGNFDTEIPLTTRIYASQTLIQVDQIFPEDSGTFSRTFHSGDRWDIEGNHRLIVNHNTKFAEKKFGFQIEGCAPDVNDSLNSLIGHWAQDELSWSEALNEVIDSSGRGHHGTSRNGAQTLTQGKIKRAGKLDGDDDYVDLGQIESGDPLQLTNGGTLVGWFRQEEGGDRWQRMFDKSTNHSGINGYALIIDPLDRSIWLGVNGSLYRSAAEVYEFDQWTHLAAVITVTDFRIYVNGLEIQGKFQSGRVKLPPDVATNMRFGTWNHATGREFRGLLDDLRVYSRALDSEEIQEIIAEISASTTLVAHYKLDEGEGCVAMDSQGDHQGDLQPDCPVDSPSWTAGRAGGALEFDGDNDLIDLGVIELGDPLQLISGGTMIGWFQQRPGDRWQRMFDKSTSHSGINGYALMVDPKDRSIWIGVNGNNYKSDPEVYEFDKWTHVTAVITETEFTVYVNGVAIPGKFVSGNAQLPPEVATGMRIGSWNHASKREFNGFLDDLRIYSNALTASDIQTIFQESKAIAGLIGHYKLDEGIGCNTVDGAGDVSPKHGNLAPNCSQNNNNGPAWSIEAVIGHALEFDGDNDLVELGMIETGHPLQLAAGGTITGWFNQRPGDRWQRILDKSTNHSGTSGYALMVDPMDRSIWIGVNGSLYKSDPEVYTFNLWTHASALITESAFALYVNGIEVGGKFITGKIQLPPEIATEMRIGSWNHATRREFNGFLDDLRIYSRALTPSEISEIYDDGSLSNVSSAPKVGTENGKIRKAKFSRSKVFFFSSQTVYEDAEDGSLGGWVAYGDGSVVNLENTSSNRIIATTGDLLGDPFRLGLENQEDWNNTKEFTASFTILMEEEAAVYFRIDTTEGEKYLCYQPGDDTVAVHNNVICFGLGIQADGQWHPIIRDLEFDLERALPGTHLLSVKDFYVYGSVKLDNLMLLKQSAD